MKTIHYIYTILLATVLFSCDIDSSGDMNGSNEASVGQGGALATFAIKGDYLYTVDNEDLKVFTLKDPSKPVLINSIWVGFEIETLFSYRDCLYIGSRSGMFIFGVEDPEQPRNLSSVQHFTACDPVVANDSLAFVTLHSNTNCGNDINQLEIYDITDSENPKLLSTRGLAEPKGLGLYGPYLIVCDDEIKVFDIRKSNGATEFVTSIEVEAFDVIIRDNLLIAVGNDAVNQYSISSLNEGVDFRHLSYISF